jgi:hypothetical protein
MDETVNSSTLSSSKIISFIFSIPFLSFLPEESPVELSPGKEKISEEANRGITFKKRRERREKANAEWRIKSAGAVTKYNIGFNKRNNGTMSKIRIIK